MPAHIGRGCGLRLFRKLSERTPRRSISAATTGPKMALEAPSRRGRGNDAGRKSPADGPTAQIARRSRAAALAVGAALDHEPFGVPLFRLKARDFGGGLGLEGFGDLGNSGGALGGMIALALDLDGVGKLGAKIPIWGHRVGGPDAECQSRSGWLISKILLMRGSLRERLTTSSGPWMLRSGGSGLNSFMGIWPPG